jgi:hypothetical protein
MSDQDRNTIGSVDGTLNLSSLAESIGWLDHQDQNR